MRRAVVCGFVAVVAALAGCGDSGGGGVSPNVPGVLTVNFQSPNGNDGAVMIQVDGGPIDSVVVSPAYRGYVSRITGTTFRAIVTGPVVTAGPIARVYVPDISQASRYGASVEQAAAKGTYAAQDVSEYRLLLSR
ncbi:MAG: hypothetical protein ACOY71_08270 [Gemmatimonadota bacterium]